MKKKTKFSLGMKIVTLLTVITMASVGFAAWVITAPVENAKAEGSIDVEKVHNESVTVTAKWVKRNSTNVGFEDLIDEETGNKPVIKYGMPTTPIANAWLTNTTDGFTENLVAYLCVTVTNKSSQKDAKLNFKFEASHTDQFNGAIDEYISAPTFTQVNAGDGAKVTNSTVNNYSNTGDENENIFEIGTTQKKTNIEDTVGNTTTYYIMIAFDWGSAVDNTNAYTYFNGKPYTEPLATTAQNYLSGLYDALSGITYTVTLSIDLI